VLQQDPTPDLDPETLGVLSGKIIDKFSHFFLTIQQVLLSSFFTSCEALYFCLTILILSLNDKNLKYSNRNETTMTYQND
jgi:hypothetical protein